MTMDECYRAEKKLLKLIKLTKWQVQIGRHELYVNKLLEPEG
jgi:hypothetical protein